MATNKLPLLNNERTHNINKRLNRLGTYAFYKVLVRDSGSFTTFTVNMILLLLCTPALWVYASGVSQISALAASLPLFNSFGISSGMWVGAINHYNNSIVEINATTLMWTCLASVSSVFLFSGVFCAFRDAFWTGKMTFIKSFARGIITNFGYALVTALVFGGVVLGMINLYWLVTASALPSWIATILFILACIPAMFVAIYFLILSSVTVTYKQSIKQNLSDTWILLWGNLPSNIFKFLSACVPVVLYFVLMTVMASLSVIWVVAMIFIGLFAIPLIWQTYMMKCFALIHPVAQVKKGQAKDQIQAA